MPVCRICLRQSFKQVYDLDFGLPKLREKLLLCIPNLDYNLLDLNYCICELCLMDLNRSFALREKFLTSEKAIKSLMTGPKDYDQLEKLAFEASQRHDQQIFKSINEKSNKTPANAIRKKEQLAAIASIENKSIKTTNGIKILLPRTVEVPPEGPIDMTMDVSKQIRTVQSISEEYSASELLSTPGYCLKTLPISATSLSRSNPNTVLIDPPKNYKNLAHGKICLLCYRQYPNSTCLRSHIRTVHESRGPSLISKRKVLSTLLKKLTPQELSDINKEVSKKCIPTACNECKITVRCNHELQYHITTIHKNYVTNGVSFFVKCQVCDITLNHKYLKLHLKGHDLKVQLTDICKLTTECVTN